MNYDRVNDESTILIIDEQPAFSELLKEKLTHMIKPSFHGTQITIIKNIKDYKRYINDSVIAIFLDIEMPVSGFKIAEDISSCNIPILFISNFEALVFDALLYQPFYFIRKKHLNEDLDKIAKWLIHTIDNQSYQLTENNIDTSIRVNDILYIRSNGNYVEIHTLNHMYTERKTLQSFMSDIRFKQFLMPARGYLVNYYNIAQASKEVISMKSGVQIYISKNRLKSFYEAYYHLLGGEFYEF